MRCLSARRRKYKRSLSAPPGQAISPTIVDAALTLSAGYPKDRGCYQPLPQVGSAVPADLREISATRPGWHRVHSADALSSLEALSNPTKLKSVAKYGSAPGVPGSDVSVYHSSFAKRMLVPFPTGSQTDWSSSALP
jgi:hypothetical protein